MLRRIVVGMAAGMLSAATVFAQAAAPAQPAAPSPFVFKGDGGVILNFVKADKTADFEMVIGKLKEALAKSEKPERKQQAAGWKTQLPMPKVVAFDPAHKYLATMVTNKGTMVIELKPSFSLASSAVLRSSPPVPALMLTARAAVAGCNRSVPPPVAAVTVTGDAVAAVSEGAVNCSVWAPVPVIARVLNVAAPLAFVVAVVAPLSVPPPLVIIVSDLLTAAGVADGLDELQARRADVAVIHVVSPEEIDPTLSGELQLLDSESGSAMELGVSLETLAAYRSRFANWLDERAGECRARGIRYVRVRTDRPLASVLLDDLRRGGLLR